MEHLKRHIAELTMYMEKRGVKAQPYPTVILKNNLQEGGALLGKTGYYEPATHTIALYISGRHPKDILRSYAHELIHHDQCLRGLFNKEAETQDPQYAQNNPYLRKMEKDAFLRGNMFFRDWTDNKKYGK